MARSAWPDWAQDVANSWDKGLRRTEDAGLGDTLVHMIGDANSVLGYFEKIGL